VTAAFSSITALLLSVLMLIGGNSLVGIVTPLRARIEGFRDLTVGLLGSVYFAGMRAGTLAAPAIIRRAGHIRAYAAFVALAVSRRSCLPLRPSEDIHRKMMTTFWRIEAGRECLPMTHKLNDIWLSWVFLFDDQSANDPQSLTTLRSGAAGFFIPTTW
jgi:hypothetical protein